MVAFTFRKRSMSSDIIAGRNFGGGLRCRRLKEWFGEQLSSQAQRLAIKSW